jgi:hypothetical protein
VRLTEDVLFVPHRSGTDDQLPARFLDYVPLETVVPI